MENINVLVEEFYNDMEILELDIDKDVEKRLEGLKDSEKNDHETKYNTFIEVMQRDKEEIRIKFDKKLEELKNKTSLNLYNVSYENLCENNDMGAKDIIKQLDELIPVKDVQDIIYGVRDFRIYKTEGTVEITPTAEEIEDGFFYNPDIKKVLEKRGVDMDNLDLLFFIKKQAQNNLA